MMHWDLKPDVSLLISRTRVIGPLLTLLVLENVSGVYTLRSCSQETMPRCSSAELCTGQEIWGRPRKARRSEDGPSGWKLKLLAWPSFCATWFHKPRVTVQQYSSGYFVSTDSILQPQGMIMYLKHQCLSQH